ncbi:MAG: heavy metal-binding domain-containing protein [Ferrovibrio sp.]|uniref:heavy metal-binding domain-containing protein n=1 Tax=Ferrovibrio sp. TaxID=1917215 RepID=UPI0026263001|nr:heavy metal-binding domain-containing protein [Ferrovibrio sp.]MCW0236209.1 heavy metal-binding domain-containing protein [Ferrovibrio sp.]
MILTTTDSVDGRKITAYLGIVAGEAVMGTNIFRDFFAGITDILGGRSGSYEKELRKAKALALESMTEEAQTLGADAVVGMDLDYQQIGGTDRQMLMVAASGTAVKLA